MPELPEVETVARQLAPRLAGRAVHSLRVLDPRLRAGRRVPAVGGRTVTSVRRSGKRVLIGFSPAVRASGGAASRPLVLAVHLRMTGRLIWYERFPEKPGHLRARFRLDEGELLFQDVRRFGTFDWYADEDEAAPRAIDPLDPGLTPAVLGELLAGSTQPLKQWLLRQDRLVGLGNIYASEILWVARLSPFAAAGSLGRGEVGRLHRAVRGVLGRAIEACGTTFSDFQDARGEEGSFGPRLAVYDRAERSCRRCRGTVERRVQQQRSTYWCPRCQG
jgi:formamidopyrimidine-DNA glycosylase